MEIDAEAAAKLLGDERNLAVRNPNVTFLKAHRGGRTNGAKEIPPMIRTLIGIAAHNDTLASTARAFGVCERTVSAAKIGNVGVDRHDEDVKEAIDTVVEKKDKNLRDVALDRLAGMFASVINDQNLGAMKPREAVSAAKDIATIVEKLTPRSGGNSVAVFVHAPRVKDEREFGEVVEVAYRPLEDKKLT